ncbi:hypothetical protein V497_06512 [Pseudogymnoascus sp. VKM F-4516 (FW-969)]|nr:hypothetical protein V497_06512 [Pseudogymnoascus sp. VKM F-4516 (FW-969)]
MSTSGHLDQWELSDDEQRALRRLGEVIIKTSTKFDTKGGGTELCTDSSLNPILSEVLVVLNIRTLFGSKPSGNSIWRISGPASRPFENLPGPAYLFPIRIHNGRLPTISDKPVNVKTATTILEPIIITPGLDFLVIMTM